jgi:hypothetical protein
MPPPLLGYLENKGTPETAQKIGGANFKPPLVIL